MLTDASIGTSTSRVDGFAKVTGAAKYAAEFNTPGLLYGSVVTSTIAKNDAANGGGIYGTTNAQASTDYLELFWTTVGFNTSNCNADGSGCSNTE